MTVGSDVLKLGTASGACFCLSLMPSGRSPYKGLLFFAGKLHLISLVHVCLRRLWKVSQPHACATGCHMLGNPPKPRTRTAHPIATEVPPGYNSSTNWFKHADAVEEWCDLTNVEARRRSSNRSRLSGRAEIFKERLDRERLRDPETGVDYFLATLLHSSSRTFSLCFFIGSSKCCGATERYDAEASS